jgi:hypothetical protein
MFFQQIQNSFVINKVNVSRGIVKNKRPMIIVSKIHTTQNETDRKKEYKLSHEHQRINSVMEDE